MHSNQEAKAITATSPIKPDFTDLVKLIKPIMDMEGVKANNEFENPASQVETIMQHIYWELFKDPQSRNKYNQMHYYLAAKYINQADSILFFTTVVSKEMVRNKSGVFRLPPPESVNLDDAKKDVKVFSSPIELITIPQFFAQSNADAKSDNYAEDVKLLCENRYEGFYEPTRQHKNVLGFIVKIETIIKEIWPIIYENILTNLATPNMQRVSNKLQAFFQELSINYRGVGLSLDVGVFPVFVLTGLVERSRLANVAFCENKLTAIFPLPLQGIMKEYANVPVLHYSNDDINTLESVISDTDWKSSGGDYYSMTFPPAQSKKHLKLVTDYFNTCFPGSALLRKDDVKSTSDEESYGNILINNRALLQLSLFADLKEFTSDHPELVSKFKELTLLRASLSGLTGVDSLFGRYEKQKMFANVLKVEELEKNPENYAHPLLKEMANKQDKVKFTSEIREKMKKLLSDPDNFIHPLLASPARIDKLRTYIIKNGLKDETQLKGLIADIRACQEQCKQIILQDFRDRLAKAGIKENQSSAEIMEEVQAVSEDYKRQFDVLDGHNADINTHLKQIETYMHNKFVLHKEEVPDQNALTYTPL